MKLQVITTIAVLTGIITTTSADAGDFDFGKALRTAQQINRVVNGPKHGGGGPIYKPLPYPGPKPLPHPGHGGGKPPVCKPKPPVCKPPIVILPEPPIYKPYPPICKPKPPHCKPKPPVCPPPVHVCPVCHHKVCRCHKPICKPPINRPPVKCYTMKLINDAGSEVFFSLNGQDYQQLDNGDAEIVKSHGRQPNLIKYHNGLEVVEYELDPTAVYGFEWEGDTLMLLEIQG